MGNVAKLGKIPPPATAVSPGSIATNLTTALTPTGDSRYVSAATKAAADALAANGNLYLASGSIPAFSSNAASIAPGTDLACEYLFPASFTLAAASALTIADTGSPPTYLNVHIVCLALTLGYVLTLKDGAGSTIGTIAASLGRALVIHLQFNGTHFAMSSIDFIGAAS